MKYLKKIAGVIRFHTHVFLNKKIKYKGIKQFLGSLANIYCGNKAKITIGEKLYMSENTTISAYMNGELNIGNNNFFNTNCNVTCLNKIDIGNNNLFGNNVVITDHNHKYDDNTKLICRQGYSYKKVEIGSDCWICANVVICAGAKIYDHIVVGANSVVNGELVEPGLYVGAPAKKIK